MKKSKTFKILIVALIAVIIIPMLYSSIYLKAFWDTYGGVDNVPVAFVNLDKQVYKDDEKYSIGEDLKNKLKDNTQVHWTFTNYEDAKNGVEGSKYYAMIIIPEDFSKKISDVKDGKIVKPEIIYEANIGKNYVFSQVSSKVAQSIKTSISENLQKNLSKVLVDNLYNMKDPLKTAADGSAQIEKGSSDLFNGGTTIKNGMDTALAGIGSLHDGLKKISTAQQQILNGTSSLKDGLNKFKTAFSQGNEGLSALTGGAKQVSAGVTQAKEGAETTQTKLSEGLNKAADGIDSVAQNLGTANTLLQSAVADFTSKGSFSAEDINNIEKASQITNAIKNSDIKTNISSPLRSTSNQLTPLITGLNNLQQGADAVSAGTQTLANTVSSSQTTALDGANKLLQGASALESGNTSLLNGLNTVTEKTSELYSGVSKLDDGVSSLNNGINSINTGSSKLTSGLQEGYNKINNNLKFTSDAMSDFISDPIVLTDKSINKVKYYGEGLAPYFMSLSLWLGAMFINLLFSILKKLKDESKYINSFLGKFIFGSLIASVQALLLSFVMIAFIKMDVANTVTFYLNNIFTAIVFFSIIYGVTSALGIIGTPIMFIVFLFQLASCAGTFPIETAPAFYRIINKFIPMTYSVSSLRMVISGINSSVYDKNIIVLLIFMIIFIAFSLLINIIRNKKTPQKMQNAKAA